jgi:proline utilization trans-activator
VSSAFIFLLVESIYATQSPQSGRQGIKGARSILGYLGGCGNEAAQRRLDDIQQLSEHLHIECESLVPPVRHPTHATTIPSTNRQASSDTTVASADGFSAEVQPEQPQYTSPLLYDIDWRQALSSLEDHGDTFDSFPVNDNSLTDMTAFDHLDGFSFGLNGDFMLTGADETDWEQFERQISRQQ